MVKKGKASPKEDPGTETRILEAARQVFTREGLNGARMQDIADAAGINKALLHYYFRDKETLFQTVFLEAARNFFPRIADIMHAEKPIWQKIDEFVNAYIDQILVQPRLPWFIMNEINRDPDAFLARLQVKDMPRGDRFMEQVEAEIKAGRIRPIDPAQLLIHVLSMTIFPFISKPILQRNLRLSDSRFRQLIEERRQEIPRFIRAALQP